MTFEENLNYQEKKAIELIRTRMKNDLPKYMFEDTILLYRFLKARDFEVDKAEDMLKKHLIWRKHFQVDTILEDFTPRPIFEKFPKTSEIGLDKNGNIVNYIPLGKLDAREIMKCLQLNEYTKHWLWHFEELSSKAKKLAQETGKDLIQLTLIMDLDKLTLGNATSKIAIEICQRLLRMLMDNYPESLNTIIIINAPGYYVFIFSILKSMMSNAMIQKIHTFSHCGWQDKLLEIIDADVLPAFLGGNRTDPDGNPLCTSFVTHGGRIPEMYYLPNEERDFMNRSLVKRITIHSKQKKEIPVHVPESGSRIQWEFLLKNRDIGFGLFCNVSESKREEILPTLRYDTTDGVEKGYYKAQSPGHYVVVFDNSYSWMNSKEVEYYITVS